MAALEHAVGSRTNLVEALSITDLDPKAEFFLELLTDPNRRHDSLARVARDAGLKPNQALDLFRQAIFSQAFVLATAHLSQKLPAVVADTADKAIDAYVKCPECRGTQTSLNKNGVSVTCPECNGRGDIMREADLDRQKIVLEATGILKKGGGVQIVNQNVQSGAVFSPGAIFSKFVRDTDEIAYEADAVDTTASEEPKS